ncbi:MAG: peptidoglycan-binding protein, partial [Oscillospiraceae bacterium]|nr:peptidoglycan-binding protein [Oscillospiraceae bacterium]
QPGDLVLFDFSGTHRWRDHVGIVISSDGSIVHTVEGNVSATSNDNGGAVMLRTRYKSQITSFIRPKWTAEQTAAKLIKIAESQVGVKESPAGSNNVKYNTWYYGHPVSGAAYPWCCVFVEWCFAVLAGEIPEGDAEKGTTVSILVEMLRYGSAGSAVKRLQILLNGLGYPCGSADGVFGAKTLAAVRSFQTAQGIAVDGIAGAVTWGRLVS